jgi:RNA polymerase sigma-70 factor (ECF subfamily)
MASETFLSLIGLIFGVLKYSNQDWEEDDRLILRLKNGEREAFARLVAKYQQDIYKLAYFKLWNRADAEEAAQEAFVRSLAAIGSLREGKKYFGFLKAILNNYCNDLRIRSKREGNPLPEYEVLETEPLNVSKPVSPEEALEKKQIIDQVRKALDRLDQDEKEIITLKHFQGLTFQEVGVRLGIPENTAKTVFYRTLEKLGRILQHAS